jgi:hypothetical protein
LTFVVALRTHLWNHGVAVLARRLAYYSQGAEFLVLADESTAPVRAGNLPKLGHGRDFSAFGLPDFPADRLLWYNADYPLYLLRRRFPEATHFAMVEYDVAVNLDLLPMLRDAQARAIDLIADHIEEAGMNWPWRYTAAAHYARPLKAFMPFMVISARAIDALLRARQAAYRRQPPVNHEDWPFAEAFIPSTIALMPNGKMAELRDYASLPLFDWRLGYSVEDPEVNQSGSICHPVLDAGTLVARRMVLDPPEAVFDPGSDLRRRLGFCEPAEFSGPLYEHLAAAGLGERYLALARDLGWPRPAVAAPPRKYLIILRAGAKSLHQGWLQGAGERLFDLVICPYQEMAQEPAALLQTAIIPGQKWAGLNRFLNEWPQWRRYDYIWLPDDDLIADGETINQLFTLAERFSANIAAPALCGDSYYSHAMTMQHRGFYARAVSFIEVMMPCFRRDVLELVLPSLAMSRTGFGWGLDCVWPLLVNYENLIIFDCLTVRHSRPGGAARDPQEIDAIAQDMHQVMAHYGAISIQQTLGAYDSERRFRPASDTNFLFDYLQGFLYLIEQNSSVLPVLGEAQRRTLPRRVLERASGAGNIALGKPALISSIWRELPERDRARAAGGGNNGRITGEAGFHTEFEQEPWWQVDLQGAYEIARVVLYNRLDIPERCTRVALSGSLDGEAFFLMRVKLDDAMFGGADGHPYVFELSPAVAARFVRVTMIGEGFLHLDEIEVFAA